MRVWLGPVRGGLQSALALLAAIRADKTSPTLLRQLELVFQPCRWWLQVRRLPPSAQQAGRATDAAVACRLPPDSTAGQHRALPAQRTAPPWQWQFTAGSHAHGHGLPWAHRGFRTSAAPQAPEPSGPIDAQAEAATAATDSFAACLERVKSAQDLSSLSAALRVAWGNTDRHTVSRALPADAGGGLSAAAASTQAEHSNSTSELAAEQLLQPVAEAQAAPVAARIAVLSAACDAARRILSRALAADAGPPTRSDLVAAAAAAGDAGGTGGSSASGSTAAATAATIVATAAPAVQVAAQSAARVNGTSLLHAVGDDIAHILSTPQSEQAGVRPLQIASQYLRTCGAVGIEPAPSLTQALVNSLSHPMTQGTTDEGRGGTNEDVLNLTTSLLAAPSSLFSPAQQFQLTGALQPHLTGLPVAAAARLLAVWAAAVRGSRAAGRWTARGEDSVAGTPLHAATQPSCVAEPPADQAGASAAGPHPAALQPADASVAAGNAAAVVAEPPPASCEEASANLPDAALGGLQAPLQSAVPGAATEGQASAAAAQQPPPAAPELAADVPVSTASPGVPWPALAATFAQRVTDAAASSDDAYKQPHISLLALYGLTTAQSALKSSPTQPLPCEAQSALWQVLESRLLPARLTSATSGESHGASFLAMQEVFTGAGKVLHGAGALGWVAGDAASRRELPHESALHAVLGATAAIHCVAGMSARAATPMLQRRERTALWVPPLLSAAAELTRVAADAAARAAASGADRGEHGDAVARGARSMLGALADLERGLSCFAEQGFASTPRVASYFPDATESMADLLQTCGDMLSSTQGQTVHSMQQMSAQELTALARDAADILACPDYTGPHALDALARSPPSQSPHRPALFCQRDVPCVASKPRERRAYEKCSAHSSPTALASTGNRGGRSVPGLDGASMHEGEPLHAVFRAAAQRALVLVPNLHMPVAAEMTYQITRGLGRHTLSHALVNILPVAHPATSDPVTWKLLLASNALTQHVSPALRAALRDAYEDAAQHGSTQHDTSQSAALQVGSGSAAPSDASAAAGSHGGPDVTSLLLTAHMSARAGIHVTERYVTAWEATCRALRGDMTAKSIPGMATGFGEACSALRAGTTATPAPDFVTRLYEARDSMRERLFAAGCAGIQAATALASCAVGPAQSHDPAAPAKQFSEALPIARRMGAASLSLVEHAYGDVWPEYIDTETFLAVFRALQPLGLLSTLELSKALETHLEGRLLASAGTKTATTATPITGMQDGPSTRSVPWRDLFCVLRTQQTSTSDAANQKSVDFLQTPTGQRVISLFASRVADVPFTTLHSVLGCIAMTPKQAQRTLRPIAVHVLQPFALVKEAPDATVCACGMCSPPGPPPHAYAAPLPAPAVTAARDAEVHARLTCTRKLEDLGLLHLPDLTWANRGLLAELTSNGQRAPQRTQSHLSQLPDLPIATYLSVWQSCARSVVARDKAAARFFTDPGRYDPGQEPDIDSMRSDVVNFRDALRLLGARVGRARDVVTHGATAGELGGLVGALAHSLLIARWLGSVPQQPSPLRIAGDLAWNGAPLQIGQAEYAAQHRESLRALGHEIRYAAKQLAQAITDRARAFLATPDGLSVPLDSQGALFLMRFRGLPSLVWQAHGEEGAPKQAKHTGVIAVSSHIAALCAGDPDCAPLAPLMLPVAAQEAAAEGIWKEPALVLAVAARACRAAAAPRASAHASAIPLPNLYEMQSALQRLWAQAPLQPSTSVLFLQAITAQHPCAQPLGRSQSVPSSQGPSESQRAELTAWASQVLGSLASSKVVQALSAQQLAAAAAATQRLVAVPGAADLATLVMQDSIRRLVEHLNPASNKAVKGPVQPSAWPGPLPTVPADVLLPLLAIVSHLQSSPPLHGAKHVGHSALSTHARAESWERRGDSAESLMSKGQGTGGNGALPGNFARLAGTAALLRALSAACPEHNAAQRLASAAVVYEGAAHAAAAAWSNRVRSKVPLGTLSSSGGTDTLALLTQVLKASGAQDAAEAQNGAHPPQGLLAAIADQLTYLIRYEPPLLSHTDIATEALEQYARLGVAPTALLRETARLVARVNGDFDALPSHTRVGLQETRTGASAQGPSQLFSEGADVPTLITMPGADHKSKASQARYPTQPLVDFATVLRILTAMRQLPDNSQTASDLMTYTVLKYVNPTFPPILPREPPPITHTHTPHTQPQGPPAPAPVRTAPYHMVDPDGPTPESVLLPLLALHRPLDSGAGGGWLVDHAWPPVLSHVAQPAMVRVEVDNGSGGGKGGEGGVQQPVKERKGKVHPDLLRAIAYHMPSRLHVLSGEALLSLGRDLVDCGAYHNALRVLKVREAIAAEILRRYSAHTVRTALVGGQTTPVHPNSHQQETTPPALKASNELLIASVRFLPRLDASRIADITAALHALLCPLTPTLSPSHTLSLLHTLTIVGRHFQFASPRHPVRRAWFSAHTQHDAANARPGAWGMNGFTNVDRSLGWAQRMQAAAAAACLDPLLTAALVRVAGLIDAGALGAGSEVVRAHGCLTELVTQLERECDMETVVMHWPFNTAQDATAADFTPSHSLHTSTHAEDGAQGGASTDTQSNTDAHNLAASSNSYNTTDASDACDNPEHSLATHGDPDSDTSGTGHGAQPGIACAGATGSETALHAMLNARREVVAVVQGMCEALLSGTDIVEDTGEATDRDDLPYLVFRSLQLAKRVADADNTQYDATHMTGQPPTHLDSKGGAHQQPSLPAGSQAQGPLNDTSETSSQALQSSHTQPTNGPETSSQASPSSGALLLWDSVERLSVALRGAEHTEE